jgi:hypothetical protein
MKRKIRFLLSIIIVSSLLCLNAFAMPYNPANYTSVDEESELLPKSAKNAIAHESAIRRGDFFSAADLIITNKGNGDIGGLAKAYMDHAVDEVYITIYLDRWDAEAERWRQVTYYDAEFYAKDYPDGLDDPEVSIVFKGQEKGYYYRLRGVFSAVYNGKFEGFSPVTAGILID